MANYISITISSIYDVRYNGAVNIFNYTTHPRSHPPSVIGNRNRTSKRIIVLPYILSLESVVQAGFSRQLIGPLVAISNKRGNG